MRARFGAPLTGRVVQVNAGLSERPSRATESPYEEGWVCVLQPTDLASELPALRIGKPVIDWYQEEIARLGKEGSPREDWSWLERTFLARSTQALVKSDR
jgi:hypothetical protein